MSDILGCLIAGVAISGFGILLWAFAIMVLHDTWLEHQRYRRLNK